MIYPRLHDSEGGGFSTSQYARLGRDCERSWRARFTNDSRSIFFLNSSYIFLGILWVSLCCATLVLCFSMLQCRKSLRTVIHKPFRLENFMKEVKRCWKDAAPPCCHDTPWHQPIHVSSHRFTGGCGRRRI